MRLVLLHQKLSGSPNRELWINPAGVCFVHPVNKKTLIGVQNWTFAVEETVEEVVKKLTGHHATA